MDPASSLWRSPRAALSRRRLHPVDVLQPVKTALGPVVEAKVRLYLRTMLDPVSGAAIPDVAVSSRSVWDQHLELRGDLPKFSLNVLNYDSISAVLLPRAVGYAAGLLDHFFAGTARGQCPARRGD